MNGDLYQLIARYYDSLHDPLSDDIDFVLALAERSPGPVLEMGCGSGRLLQPLVEAGIQATGIDLSPSMLSRARIRLSRLAGHVRARAQLVLADMTEPPLKAGHFGLVLIPYNTFLHLGPDDALAACCAARQQLQQDGRLLLDLINPASVGQVYNDEALSLERILNEGEDLVLVFSSSYVRQTEQILEITWIYDTSPRAGGAVQRTVADMVYHYYYPHQIELMLEQSGMRLEALYGDYDGSAYDESSERLLIVAQREEL